MRKTLETGSFKKSLAKEVTVFVHGQEEYEKAVETTRKLFANMNAPAESLSEQDLESIEGVISHEFDRIRIIEGVDMLTLLTETNIFKSKGEAKKMIQNGGISINRIKLSDIHRLTNNSDLLHDKFILIQVGKKNYYLVKAV